MNHSMDRTTVKIQSRVRSLQPVKQQNVNKGAKRATLACVSCRARRSKCVLLTGEYSCILCSNQGIECEFTDRDRRRIPHSRTYVTSLCDRVTILENALKRHGIGLPGDGTRESDINHIPDLGKPTDKLVSVSTGRVSEGPNYQVAASYDRTQTISSGPPDFTSAFSRPKDAVKQYFSNKIHLEQLLYWQQWAQAELCDSVQPDTRGNLFEGGETPKRQTICRMRNATDLLVNIDTPYYLYLLSRFWECYSCTNPTVHTKHFEDTLAERLGCNCLVFLKLCVLAMGAHYAKINQANMWKFNSYCNPDFYQEAINRVAFEIGYADRISVMAGLIILSDLDFALGNDDLASTHSAIALNMARSLVLHTTKERISNDPHKDDNIQTKYLARTSQMIIQASSNDRGTFYTDSAVISAEPELNAAMLAITDFTIAVVDCLNMKKGQDTANNTKILLQRSKVEKQLARWYRGIGKELRWTPKSSSNKPIKLLAPHLQYHYAMILLHWPDIGYDFLSVESAEVRDSKHTHATWLAHSVCVDHAIRIAEILVSKPRMFRNVHPFPFTIQYIAIAMLVLLETLSFSTEDTGNVTLMAAHLQSLDTVLAEMAPTFVPAQQLRLSSFSAISKALSPRSLGSDIAERGTQALPPILALCNGKGDKGFFLGSTIDSNNPEILRLAALHVPELMSP